MLILPAPETPIVTAAHSYPSHLAVSVYPTAMILTKQSKKVNRLLLLVEAGTRHGQCSGSKTFQYGSGPSGLISVALYLVTLGHETLEK